MKAVSLELNTRTASRKMKNRFLWIPRGAQIDHFSPEELAVFKRALRWQRKQAIEFILPNERVAKCYRVRIQSDVKVHYSPKVKRAHYGGLVICGSVWMCPVCAAKITERRRLELEKGVTQGLSFFMVTITLQHTKRDKLTKLLSDFSDTWRKVTAGRGWQDIKQRFQLVGSVTGREVTYGIDFGWHPHLHILYYSRLAMDKIDTEEIRGHISSRFEKELSKIGRYAHPLHAVKVTKGEDATRLYIAKIGLDDSTKQTWNLVSEITKSPVKIGLTSGDHYSPFQLVDLYMCGDRVAGQRFIEYALAMKGRKQLTYSRGLRELLEIGADVTDQELAERQDQDARLLATLSADHWRIILQRGKRGALLEVASSGDYRLFRLYCLTLGIDDLPTECPA